MVSPVVIVGVPRTGTTMMHKLLSMDEGFQVLQIWVDCLSDGPPSPGVLGGDARVQGNGRGGGVAARAPPCDSLRRPGRGRGVFDVGESVIRQRDVRVGAIAS